jgi:hypothetical protein
MSYQLRLTRGASVWWLTPMAWWGELEWSWGPRGPMSATWKMDLPASYQHPALRAGTLVDIMLGSTPVWCGALSQPDRADGWSLSADGPAVEANDAPCFANGSWDSTATPDVAIDQGIARGMLHWKRPASISNTPFSAEATDGKLNTVAELLDAWCDENAQAGWMIDASRNVTTYEDAGEPDYMLFPDEDFHTLGLADEDYASHLFGVYQDTTGAYLKVTSFDAAAGEAFGRKEQPVDLTPLGPMAGSRAQDTLDGIMAAGRAKPAYTNGLSLTAGQVRTKGQAPVPLHMLRTGKRIRIHGARNPLATGESFTDITIGETDYAAGETVIGVTPTKFSGDNLGDAIAEALG